ncbi:MAG: anthranilate phosphoribosyltransferase [Candidatus Heimdallarchaeota archaeon]|nr:anthranilate phosphoribosyltransferase [Candidatus Heimdallarchaeota archaeon]
METLQSYHQQVDLPNLTEKVLENLGLSHLESYNLMSDILLGRLDDIQLSSILTAIRINMLSGEEIAGFSECMLDNARKINYHGQQPLIDVVGTGGAKFKTYNVSTTTALILPLLGVSVAKHGNRSSTSKSGSADLLESLGINKRMDVATSERALNELGLTFMFAPTFHPAMAKVIPVRQKLKIRTIFNLLGPLTNPASVKRQLTGLYSPKLLRPIAKSLKARNYERVALVNNELGADEIIQIGSTTIVELNEGCITEYKLTASDFGVDTCNPYDISNLRPEDSAKKCIDILRGEKSSLSDFVAINAAMALRVAGIEDDLKTGVSMVYDALETGNTIDLIRRFVIKSNGDIDKFSALVE